MKNPNETKQKARVKNVISTDVEFAKDLTNGEVFGRPNNSPSNHNDQHSKKKS